ncbi:MAG: glycosyltransferase family 2 protein [Thermodesulfobacteriota bacterium]
MNLSVIIPVYNEKDTIEAILRRVLEVKLEEMGKEVIVVDDGSKDGTIEILQGIAKEWSSPNLKIFFHSQNQGKGAAIRTALNHITGDIVIIQDADLEYHPEEYPILVLPILKYGADVVYGTRFLGIHRSFLFWHYMGNKFLTFVTNLLYDSMLSDMEVGYKAFRAEIIKQIPLKARGFEFEPEITAKILKRKKLRLYEVPITYSGRDYDEGKKITWRDGFTAIWTLLKYRFKD